jgi:hypothetical protein
MVDREYDTFNVTFINGFRPEVKGLTEAQAVDYIADTIAAFYTLTH